MTTRTSAEVRAMARAERERIARSLETLPLREVREAQLRIRLIDELLGWFERPNPDDTRVGATTESHGY